jgi:putative SOS response-associated peptidase YedK
MAQNYPSELPRQVCGKFSLEQYPETIMQALGIDSVHFKPRAEVFPGTDIAVAVHTDHGNELASMHWGWRRSFAKRPLINTRSAEAWEKKTWSESMHKRRCIIPASGFFEWDQNQPKGKKDCYKITPADDDGFALGGIYEINADGEMFASVLTTAPNEKMKSIHHRMPVIVNKDKFSEWFESDDRLAVTRLMQPLNSEGIELHKMQ